MEKSSQTYDLHIYHGDFFHRKLHVYDSDEKKLELFTVSLTAGGIFVSTPHMTIRSAKDNSIVGTVSFASWWGHVNINVHGHDIEMSRRGWISKSHQYTSFKGNRMKWKFGNYAMGDMTCIDESADPSAQPVAQFHLKKLSFGKIGTLEVSSAVQDEVRDELVVSGLAMYQWQRRQNDDEVAPTMDNLLLTGGGA